MEMKYIDTMKQDNLLNRVLNTSRIKLFALLCSLTVLWLDRITKTLALNNLVYTKSYPVLTVLNSKLNFGLNWFLTFNYGTAFSFIKEAAGYTFHILLALSVFITIALLAWIYKEDKKHKITIIAIGAIIGGALGNIYDRIVYGFVVDFIDVYAGSAHWPVFNVADIAVSVGVILLFYTQLIANGK